MLSGNTRPVRDPSIMRQGSTYYIFSTDPMGQYANNLPIRCSQDRVNWTACGHVFDQPPAWVTKRVPGMQGLWAPDISYFNGLYHVYYAGSTLGSQASVIGLVTNTTLDPADPAYAWVDQGEVLESSSADDFNAIDPNILVDADGRVWLNYGSYWTGIKQHEIDASTGHLSSTNPVRYDLAERPYTPIDPIEGSSLVARNGYYYLFVSMDYCCNPSYLTDNYKEAVGRATSPHGPFVDMSGTPMLSGGGTVLLASTPQWIAPGGGTVYMDRQSGAATLVFHALDASQNGAAALWVLPMSWTNDWPSF